VSTKITPEVRKRCREIAALKAKIPTYKELEIETGIHRNYLAKVVHQIAHEECSTLGDGPLEPEEKT
jgi:hypothetical protein